MRSITKKMTFEDKWARKFYCPNHVRRYTQWVKKLNNKKVRQSFKKEIQNAVN